MTKMIKQDKREKSGRRWGAILDRVVREAFPEEVTAKHIIEWSKKTKVPARAKGAFKRWQGAQCV